MNLQLSLQRLGCAPSTSRSRRIVSVKSEADGVESLLARDRKTPKVSPDLDVSFEPEIITSRDKERAKLEKAKREKEQEVLKSRKQRQEDMAQAKSIDPNRPKSCKQAIDKGLALFQEKKFQEAIDMFNVALELPGNGAYRLYGSVREFSCPSDAEENAALYNMACAYAQLGKKAAALTCIEAVLENEFNDTDSLRKDPDLEPIRGAEFEALMFKYTNLVAKTGLFGGQKQKVEQSDSNKSKPWILW